MRELLPAAWMPGLRGWPVRVLQAIVLLLPAAIVYLGFVDSPGFFDDDSLSEWVRTARAGLSVEPRAVALLVTLANLDLAAEPLFALRVGNLVIHLLNVLMVWWLGELLLSAVRGPSEAKASPPLPLAYLAALFFSLHPVAAYATGYVIQRTILLSTLFALLAAILHLQAQVKQRSYYLVGAVLCYALSVFSKEHSVLLPAALLMLTYWARQNGFVWRRAWNWVLPAYAGIGIWILSLRHLAVRQGTLYEPMAQTFAVLPEHPYLASIATQMLLFFKYVALWIYPDTRWMSVDVQHDLSAYVLPWLGILAFLTFCGVSIGAWRLLVRSGESGIVGLAILWAVLLFGTELWAMRLSESFVLYRSYLWMPLVPLATLLVLHRAVGRILPAPRFRHSAYGVMVVVLLFIVGGGLIDRLQSMSSSRHLWEDAVVKNSEVSWPGVARAYTNLGIELARAGDREAARRYFETAIAYNPAAYPAYCALATVYLERRDYLRARPAYEKAMSIAPNDRCVARLRMYF